MTGDMIGDVAVPDPHGWLNVADGIFHNARRRPSHPAIVDPARTLTYAELAELVSRTAGHLATIGARPGDMIGVALGDDADHVVALLAIAWLGAVILPMDIRWTAEEKRRRRHPFRRALRAGAGRRGADRRRRDHRARRDLAARRRGVRRRGAVRAPARAAAAAVAVLRHHRRAERPAGDARPHAEPAVHLHGQPDVQRRRPLHRGDPALFRRRPLHDHGVPVHGRDGGDLSGAVPARGAGARRQRPGDHVAVPGADAAAAAAGAAQGRRCR